MPEITKRVRIVKILTFSIDERAFSKLENRCVMIMGRNIKSMSFSKWMAMVLFVSCTRTSRVKPGLFSFSIREIMRNV